MRTMTKAILIGAVAGLSYFLSRSKDKEGVKSTAKPFVYEDFQDVITPDVIGAVHEQLSRHRSLILIRGASGSGKSIAYHQLLSTLDRMKFTPIYCIEAKSEYKNPELVQIETGWDVDDDARQKGFAKALRFALKCKSSVIGLEEMRGAENLSLVCDAVYSGHHVVMTEMTSLHNVSPIPEELKDLPGIVLYVDRDYASPEKRYLISKIEPLA